MNIALFQHPPIFLNKQKTLEKMTALIEQAAKNNAELCVFPESYLPGYPIWVFLKNSAIFGDEAHKRAYSHYRNQSVSIHGPEIKTLIHHAKKHNIIICTGISEHVETNDTLYCTMLIIHPRHGLVTHHRKLISTHTERTIWGPGDAAGLTPITHKNWRIGALNCWENWMPLSRFSLYAQGENLHISLWPGDSELSKDITRFIALEGRMYSLAAGGILRPSDIPDNFELKDALLQEDQRLLNGGSCAWSPSGQELLAPSEGIEQTFYIDTHHSAVTSERRHFDPAGHYNDPTVFNFTLNKTRRTHISITRDETEDTDFPNEHP